MKNYKQTIEVEITNSFGFATGSKIVARVELLDNKVLDEKIVERMVKEAIDATMNKFILLGVRALLDNKK
jgi:hypothetical protein